MINQLKTTTSTLLAVVTVMYALTAQAETRMNCPSAFTCTGNDISSCKAEGSQEMLRYIDKARTVIQGVHPGKIYHFTEAVSKGIMTPVAQCYYPSESKDAGIVLVFTAAVDKVKAIQGTDWRRDSPDRYQFFCKGGAESCPFEQD